MGVKMTFSFVDEPTDESPSTGFSFVDEAEPQPKEENKRIKTAPEKVVRAAVRGVGTGIADFAKQVVQPNKGSLPSLLGLQDNEAVEEPKWATKLREVLPSKDEDEDDFILGAVERTGRIASHPVSLALGPAGWLASGISGVSGETAKTLGFGETGQAVAEILGPIGHAISPSLKSAPIQPPAAATNKGGLFAKAEVRTTPAQIEERLNAIGKDAIERYEISTMDKAKPFKRGEFNAKDIAKDLEDLTINKDLDAIAPKPSNKMDFGNNLKAALQHQFETAEKHYGPVYRFIEQKAPGIEVSSESVIKYIDEVLKDVSALETKPANYETVIKTLKNIQNDLGGKTTQLNLSLVPETKYGKIPLSKKIEIKRRINKIVDYDIPEKSIKDKLKPVNHQIQAEIKSDLGKIDKNWEKAYTYAEKLFGKTAEKFGTDTLHKIRFADAPEKIASLMDSPTALKELRNILPPAQYAHVERQVLEKIKDMSPTKAAAALNELSPYLSRNGKTTAENIVKFKDPKFFQGNWNKHANAIMSELQDSFTNGTRPENTLKLMQTREGYKTVYETLHNTSTGKKALGSLQKQYIDDMVSSALNKDGSLNWDKLSSILHETPTNQMIVRQVLGKKGLDEAKKMTKYAENIKHNFDKYGPKNLKDYTLGTAVKKATKEGALPLIGFMTGGLPLLASAAVINQTAKGTIFLTRRMLASPKAQAAFKELANPKTWENGRAEIAAIQFAKAAAGAN